jgi:hypothetical protein
MLVKRRAPIAVAAGGPFTDDFNRANGGLGTNWTNVLSTMNVASNAATGTAGQDTLAAWNPNDLTTTHYGQVTIGTFTSTENVGVCVRVSLTQADGYCYYAYNYGDRQVYRINAGSFTLLDTQGGTWATGDTMKITVSGTGATVTLTMYKNGSLDTILGTNGVISDTAAARLVTQTHAGMSVFSATNSVDNFQCNSGN